MKKKFLGVECEVYVTMKKIYGYNSGFGDTLQFTHTSHGKYQILIPKMDVGKLRKILTNLYHAETILLTGNLKNMILWVRRLTY